MANLRLGIRAHDVPASSLTELFAWTKQFPFTNYQFAPRKLGNLGLGDVELTPGLATFIKNRLDQQGLTVSILGCYINMIHPDPQIREANLQRFEQYLSLSRYFGNAIVATETGTVNPDGYTTDNFTDTAFDQVVASVQRLARTAEKLGTVFAIEAGVNHPVNTIAKLKHLVQAVDSPNLKIIFDPVNLITIDNYQQQEKLIDDFLTEFSNRIIMVHLKDFVVEENQIKIVSFGQGVLSCEYLIRSISKRFPHGFCTFEGIKPEDIKPALSKIQQWVTLDTI